MDKIDYKKLFKDVVSKDRMKYALMNPSYDCKNDTLVATNGHLLIKIENVKKDILITSDRKDVVIIPMRIFELVVQFEKEFKFPDRLHHLVIEGSKIGIWRDDKMIFEDTLIDEMYPDINSIIPEKNTKPPKEPSIGINLNYMKAISMALNQGIQYPNIEFNFTREIAPILMYCEAFEQKFNVKLTILLAPVKLHSDY